MSGRILNPRFSFCQLIGHLIWGLAWQCGRKNFFQILFFRFYFFDWFDWPAPKVGSSTNTFNKMHRTCNIDQFKQAGSQLNMQQNSWICVDDYYKLNYWPDLSKGRHVYTSSNVVYLKFNSMKPYFMAYCLESLPQPFSDWKFN